MSYRSEVVSVQVGIPRKIDPEGLARPSGIDKRPAPSIVVSRFGVDGDHIEADYHGGSGQAVYVYSREDYLFFESENRTSLPPGVFGENVTVERLPTDPRVGDRLVFERGVVLEITGPRTPCATFAARMREVIGPASSRDWVKRFKAARRPGVYCRVIVEGRLEGGLGVSVERAPDNRVLVSELADLYEARAPDGEVVGRAIQSPVDERIAAWLGTIAQSKNTSSNTRRARRV